MTTQDKSQQNEANNNEDEATGAEGTGFEIPHDDPRSTHMRGGLEADLGNVGDTANDVRLPDEDVPNLDTDGNPA